MPMCRTSRPSDGNSMPHSRNIRALCRRRLPYPVLSALRLRVHERFSNAMGPGRRFRCTNHKEIPTMSVISKETTFLGYPPQNPPVRLRNHILTLPLDDLPNAAAEAVAHNIKGALAIPHPYGRLQFGADLDLHFRTLIGAGCNPNVAAVVVIGIEDSWTRKVVDGIASTGKPALGFGIEGHGDHETILRASRAAREFVQWASDKPRQPRATDPLSVSTTP